MPEDSDPPKSRKKTGRRSVSASTTPLPDAQGAITKSDSPDGQPVEDIAAGALAIVALGASAGGVDALGRFFDAMPPDSGLAFVVVMHLDPTHDSQMAAVLARHTTMPVCEVVDGMRILANHVFVIAPNRSMTIRNLQLHMSEPTEPRGQRLPIDTLFSSLATEQHERSIAVVLSGTGADGSHGLKDVKASGGLILVQDAESAAFDGMPRSASATGVADYILAPEEMPETIQRYMRHDYVAQPGLIESADQSGSLSSIISLLNRSDFHGFDAYKENMLARRVHRRMGIVNMPTIADYIDYLSAKPDEIQSLVRDLLINVTAFFRDPEAWQVFAKSVLSPLIAEQNSGAEIRIWVPACSTGEEVYSIAMLAVECAEAAHKVIDFKIFATDNLEENLQFARRAVYSRSAVASIDPSRRTRFFETFEQSFQVKKPIREMVVFARQNLLSDPPISRMDIVSCRNVLIYFKPEAQKRVLALLHFSLRPGGYLFLGSAETIGDLDSFFECVSKKWRAYRKYSSLPYGSVDFPQLRPLRGVTTQAENRVALQETPAHLASVVQKELLERFVPASVLVDQKARVLYFHGSTRDFLESPPGAPTRDLLSMVRAPIRPQLRRALRTAMSTHQSVTFDSGITQEMADHWFSVTVAPVTQPGSIQASDRMLLVSFQTARGLSPKVSDKASIADKRGSTPHSQEDELLALRAELNNTVEQMERSAQELKAANEEVISMNEELQSTNEELESSKEELQSFNEELHTINGQLQYKLRELEELTNDKENLLAATRVATIFLDDSLCIRWFSPAATAFLDLIFSDIGRPFSHFAPKFSDKGLIADIAAVQKDLVGRDAEVSNDSGRWYLRRLLPYRTTDNQITGVVMTFTDITERKQAADLANEERLYCQAIVETIRQPLLVLDESLHIHSANPAFYVLFKVSPASIKDKLFFDMDEHQWDVPELRSLLTRLVTEEGAINDVSVNREFKPLGRRTMLVNARRLARGGNRAALILLAIEDITERTQAEAHRDLLISELNHRVGNMLATVEAVASQSLHQSASLEDFSKAFSGRLMALGRSNALLVSETWGGTDIREVIGRTLEPYTVGDHPRITMEGPIVMLASRACASLSMVLHELATNAAKYGALSVPEGKLSVTWRWDDGADDPRVSLRWVETGGPPVAPPSRRGFGSKLIEMSMGYELRGSATLDYSAAGLQCTLMFPWVSPSTKPQ